jgi:hypothetical protein
MDSKRPFTETVRLLRTPHSERILLRARDADVGVLDIHYPSATSAAATLIVFDDANVDDGQLVELLEQIDRVLLPDASLSDQSLRFTVVRGRAVGTFLPVAE